MSNKTKIWIPLIIVNIVLATVLILSLVPISSQFFKNLIGRGYYWPPEPGYMASWDRDLNEGEINYLVQWLRDQFYPHPVLHLARHGDEPLVIDALLLAVDDDRIVRSIGAEVALYRIGIDKEERWANILNLLCTGGLEEDELYILDLDIHDPNLFNTPGIDRDKNFDSGVILQHLEFILLWALDPVEDANRIPDLLELLDSDSLNVKSAAIGVFRGFLHDQNVVSAMEEFAENESNPDLRYSAQRILDLHRPEYDFKTYEDWVMMNRNGFKLSMGLILLITAGSIGLGIYLTRKLN